VRTQSHPWNTELLLSGKVPKNILSNKFINISKSYAEAEHKAKKYAV